MKGMRGDKMKGKEMEWKGSVPEEPGGLRLAQYPLQVRVGTQSDYEPL